MLATVVLADDHALFRTGLRLLIEDALAPGEVLETADFPSFLATLATRETQLAIVDLRMPGLSGPEALAEVRQRYPAVRLIVVSGSEDRKDILATLASGAHGFVPKAYSPEEMIVAFRQVLDGGVHAPRLLATAVSTAPSARGHAELRREIERELTPRQRDVIRLLGEGQSNKEIARALDISEATVKIHLAAIFRILDVRNRTEAVLKASQITR